jgi:hypothetical protein
MNLPADKVHWPRGGSQTDRIMACPGSVNEQAKYPAEPSGPAAIDGTHTHALLEYCVNNNYWDASLLIGMQLTDHEGTFVVNADRATRVNVALNYVNNRMRAAQGAGFGVELVSEGFFDCGSPYGVIGCGGSADLLLLFPDGVEIIDYKDGGKDVPVETDQLVNYAGGVINAYSNRRIDWLRLTVIQPKRYSEPRWLQHTREEFDARLAKMINVMRVSMRSDAPRVPGDHCTWCRGAKPGRCPEFNQSVADAIDINTAFGGIVTQPMTVAVTRDLPFFTLPDNTEEMTNEQITRVLDAEPLITEWLKEVRKKALERAMNGATVSGYKVVRGTTHRKYDSEAELIEELEGMRLKREVYLESKLKSPAKLLATEEIKQMGPRRRKKIEEHIIKPEGALTLVPDSDPRQSALVDVAKAFADVPKVAAPTTTPTLSFL